MAYSFDGTNDRFRYATGGLFAGLTEFTVQMWAIAGGNDQAYVSERETVASAGGGVSPLAMLLGEDPAASGKWRFLTIDDTPLTEVIYSNSAASTTTYEHVVGTWDSGVGGELAMYVNGTKQTDTNDTSDNIAFPSSYSIHQGFKIGGYSSDNEGGTDDFCNGTIAEVAAWNRVLTSGEISALAAGASPLMIASSSLIFYAPLSGHSNEIIGGFTKTTDDAPSAAAHSPIIYPSNNILGGSPAKGKLWINDDPTLTGAKQITHPGTGWTSTEITVAEMVDLSGFDGTQLYVGVQRADGAVRWQTIDAFGVYNVSTDDDVPDTEDPWTIAGARFGAR